MLRDRPPSGLGLRARRARARRRRRRRRRRRTRRRRTRRRHDLRPRPRAQSYYGGNPETEACPPAPSRQRHGFMAMAALATASDSTSDEILKSIRPFLTVTRKRKRVPESCFGCHKERQPTKNEKRNWRSFSGHTKTSVVFVCPENKFGREMAGFCKSFSFFGCHKGYPGPESY